MRVRKRFSEKVNKSKDPTIRTKNLKRSSYLWPSKYLNHAISPGTWLGTLHISRCLPEDLDRLPPRVTAPPRPTNVATSKRSHDSPRSRGAALVTRTRPFCPVHFLTSAVTAEPLLPGGVRSGKAPSRGSLWGRPEGLGTGAVRTFKSARCTWRHPSPHIDRS